MRTVGRFQLVARDSDRTRLEFCKSSIEAWRSSKFIADGEGWKIRKTSEPAQIDFREYEEGASYLQVLRTHEFSGSSEFNLITRLLHHEETTYLEVEVRAGGAEELISTAHLVVKSPAFFKEIVQKAPGWRFRIGSDQIFGRAFLVSASEAQTFVDLLVDPGRRLPIVAVSKTGKGELVDNLSARLSHTLCGLAHVCILDEEASWFVTGELGSEWSCFNNAVRIYWPRSVLNSSPFRHRLWLPEHFVGQLTGEANIDWRIAGRISAPIVSASAFAPRLAEVAAWEAKADQLRFEREVSSIRSDRDYERLAEAYALENDRLRLTVTSLQEEVDRLQRLVVSAEDCNDILGSVDDLEDLRTVLSTWMSKKDSRLIFSDHVLEQFESINPHGCPPEKLHRHFEALSELAQELHAGKGALGKTTVKWLKDRGIESSNESDTKKGSGLFKFPIEGRQMEFELHMKVTDRTSPDKCIRIYFEPAEDNSVVYVGFVGSKKELL